jgi:cytochrome P450
METSMRQITPPNLASPQFKANPHPFYARLRTEAPVYRTTLPNRQVAWIITRYDDVVMVLKDQRFVKDLFNATTPEQRAKMPWVPGILKPLSRNMLDVDEPDHKRLRTLVNKAFTPRLVEQQRDTIQTLCDQLLNAVQRRGTIEVVSQYALPLPVAIIADLLGIPPGDRAKFQRWSHGLVSVSTTFEMLRALPRVWVFMRYLRKLFKLKRSNPDDDLITALVQAEEAGTTLSEDELLAMVFLLLLAGHETTVNLIASGTLALLQHPDQMQMLKENPALIKPAVEELLRYTSPVDIATERFAGEDITVAGTTIPRGELVLAVLGSANHDEQQFTNPDTLDIMREPNKHLAFGHGIHFCLGAPLARLEAQIAINTLLRRLPDLRLKVPVESLRWRKGLVVRGVEHLPLIFDR